MWYLCRVSILCCAAGNRFPRPLAKALPGRSAVRSRPAAVRDREWNDRGQSDRSRGPPGSGRKRSRGGGLGFAAHGLVDAAQVVRSGAFGGIRTNGGGSSPTLTGHGPDPGTWPSRTWTNRHRITPCGRPKAASRHPRGRGSTPPTWTVSGGEIMYRRGGAAAGRHHTPVAAADDHGGIAQPIDERADRRVFRILDQRGVVERPHQPPLRGKQFQQALVVDVEAERARRRVKVRTVDEDRDALVGMKIHGFVICLSLHGPAGCGGSCARVLVRSMPCGDGLVVNRMREPMRGQ